MSNTPTVLEGQMVAAPMTEQEARDCTAAIRGHINQAGALLLDMDEREGWRALDYPSWRAWAEAEFGQSKAYLYQQLAAARAIRNVSAIADSLPDNNLLPANEAQARPLTNLSPGQQAEAWQEVVESAPTDDSGERLITAQHVAATVERYKAEHDIASLPKPIAVTHTDAWTAYWRSRVLEAIRTLAETPMSQDELLGSLQTDNAGFLDDNLEAAYGWLRDLRSEWKAANN